jgi:hypothetical protein
MAARRGWLWLVLFVLVAAQTLGLMHRVVHPGGGTTAPQAFEQVQGDKGAAGSGWIAGLISSHDDTGCRLFDQLGQGGMIPQLPAMHLPVMAPAFVVLWFQGEYLARWAALFDARGPPSVR